MATIRVREGSRGVTYECQVRLRGHAPITRTFRSLTLAKKWGRDTESNLERGEVVTNEAHQHTLADAIKRFLRQRPDLGRSAVTGLNWWSKEHGHRRLSAVTPAWITEVRDGLVGEPVSNPQDGKSYRQGAGNANRLVTYLAAVLGKGNRRKSGGALAWGWIRTNPAATVSKLPEPPGRVRWLSDVERQRLLEICAKSPEAALRPFVLCALSSGARAGELLALRWRDVDLQAGRATISSSKSGDGRTLYFVGAALDALKLHAKVRPLKGEARVFASDATGRYPFQYDEPFRLAAREAGIANFRFHDLRHTCASYLAQQGASLLEIGQVLGHKSQQTTARYAHLARSHTEDLVARVLGEKLGGG